MAKVRFLETYTTREPVPQVFEAGEVYDVSPASADFWVTSGKAERADELPTRTTSRLVRTDRTPGGSADGK